MTDADFERHFREWLELMDFGWRYCLEVFPQTYPGQDPMEKLREVFRRKGEEHARGNERMLEALGRVHGR